jgi:hypothetical protein
MGYIEFELLRNADGFIVVDEIRSGLYLLQIDVDYGYEYLLANYDANEMQWTTEDEKCDVFSLDQWEGVNIEAALIIGYQPSIKNEAD